MILLKPTHLPKFPLVSLHLAHPAQPCSARSQEALAKGDDLEQALQCRQELRCLWQQMLLLILLFRKELYTLKNDLTFSTFRVSWWNGINKFYPDLMRCWFSMSGDFHWASKSDYFNSVLFDVLFNMQIHQNQHPKPWIGFHQGFPVDPPTKGTYLQLVAREPQQRAAAVSWSAHRVTFSGWKN